MEDNEYSIFFVNRNEFKIFFSQLGLVARVLIILVPTTQATLILLELYVKGRNCFSLASHIGLLITN